MEGVSRSLTEADDQDRFDISDESATPIPCKPSQMAGNSDPSNIHKLNAGVSAKRVRSSLPNTVRTPDCQRRD